jgi:hypothetical protein
MKPVSNWRTLLGGLSGGLLVVFAFAAMTVTNGAAAAPANERDEGTPRSPGTSERTAAAPTNSKPENPGSGSSGPSQPGSGRGTRTPTPDIAGVGLRVVDPPPNAWVQIQWTNWSTSKWVPVDAWSGPLSQNENGYGAVYFGPEAYGNGPFRWVVFDGNPAAGGQVWAISDTFYLGWFGALDVSTITRGENLGKLASTPVPDPKTAFYSPKGAEFKGNPDGCGHYTIAGDVLSASGRALSEYRLRLTYPSGITETVNAGGAPNYGRSGFGYILAKVHPGQAYRLELLPKGQDYPISQPVTVVFSGDCTTNYAWVVFQSRR